MSVIVAGDMLDILPGLPEQSIDAVVTDPPYGLGFMGRAWDHGVPGVPYWQAVRRVLKTGGSLLAFGGTRTYHRLTCAIEDAGFEIRDCLMWLYGSGFPKGKGCLKPGWEPIILARKPGPRPWLNIDGCRLSTTDDLNGGAYSKNGTDRANGYEDWRFKRTGDAGEFEQPAGRWPANCLLSHEPECREVGTVEIPSRGGATRPTALGRLNDDVWQPTEQAIVRPPSTVAAWECVYECAVRLLDAQSGVLAAGRFPAARNTSSSFQRNPQGEIGLSRSTGDGGASRFFYCAKASPSERGAFNDWPTVKPLALMQWLVRLVTNEGDTVLDPFMGSGSTLLAADRERRKFIGVDQDTHAVEIARRRIAEDAGMFAEVS